MPENPFLIEPPVCLSFSGGRTSGYMLRLFLDAHGGRLPPGYVVIFCNTGKERPETLDFVECCSVEWDQPIVWLEYRRWLSAPDPAEGRWLCKPKQARADRTGFEVVSYATADRSARPFNEVIASKSMLPNVAKRYCTQWLKIKTNWRYCRNVLGWKEYANAIGLRYDEHHRSVESDPKSTPGEWPFCPLKDAKVTRADVMGFWKKMRGGVELQDWLDLPPDKRPGWDLTLRPDEGNCDLCFLKGQGKLLRLMRERADLAAWWIEQEQRFKGKTRRFDAARFRKDKPSYAATLKTAKEQMVFEFEDEGESPSCRCTD